MILWAHASQAQNLAAGDVKPKVSVRISVERMRLRLGEDVKLHVEIWNEGDQDIFVFKKIDDTFSNALATIHLTMYQGDQVVGPTMAAVSDSFSSERSVYPPLVSELPRYWIALPPKCFYGRELVMKSTWFEKLRVPGKYRIQGKYSSRGFLAQDVNNPLAHYAQELKELPYEAWVGSVETNSVLIEVTGTP
jgi:hypothetical protein